MLPRSGGYAQKTTLVGTRVAMTKTRRAFSIILEQFYNSRKPTALFLNFSGRVRWGAVARTLTPTGARQLIGCTGSIVFKSRW